MSNEPTDGLRAYQSIARVLAGEIKEVCAVGCYVTEANGDAVLRTFPENMTARYQPVVGDRWIVYPDGYQALIPKAAFEDRYMPIEAPKA